MADQYMRELLRVAVAQVCQTIGYHVIQATPLELLQDTLHKFLHEFSRDLRRQVEHYNRTEPNLSDTCLTFNNLNINVHELLDYINNVQPVSLAIEVPKFPVPKCTNLNFLKPGSREVLIRPVHIYEYLPPILPTDASKALPIHYMQSSSLYSNQDTYRGNNTLFRDINHKVSGKNEKYLTGCGGVTASNSTKQLEESQNGTAVSELSPLCLKTSISLPFSYDEEGRPTREISSVVMTTGGFISPAIEGKLPDTIVPKFVEKLLGLDALPPPTPPPPSILERNFAKEINHGNTSKAEVKDSGILILSQSSKTGANVSKSSVSCEEVVNTILSHTSAPKEILITKNNAASDVANTGAAKKSVLNNLTQHSLPTPTLASKLLKKAKKKNTQNLQSPVKFTRLDLQNSETDLFATGKECSQKVQRKNKKMLQKIMKTGMDSSTLSPDYCSAVFQRLKMEKFLKKQSKHQKKLLNKQRTYIDSNKSDEASGLSRLHETKLPLPLPLNTEINTVIPSVIESLPTQSISQDTEPTCLPKAALSQISLPLRQQLTKYSSNAVSNAVGKTILGNVQLPTIVSAGHDKKLFPAAKLSAELDKNKLNIFKKISKQKAQKSLSPNINRMSLTQSYGSNEGQFINLPCGTTITSATMAQNRLTSGVTHTVFPEVPDKSINLPINDANGGALDLATNINSSNFSCVLMPAVISDPPLHIVEVNKPKKRGRKPGSKNSPKQPVLPPSNPSQVVELKKMKKLKAAKYPYPFPFPNLELTNIMANRMQLGSRTEEFSPLLSHTEDEVPTNLSQNAKDNRKERKKGRVKGQQLNMSSNEHNVFKQEVPTKEEVNTINKKLMRMDTVLQPLGSFNEAMMEPDKEIVKAFANKMLSTRKSPTSKKRSIPQVPLQHHPNSRLIPGLHPNMFLPTPTLGSIPNLLKLCPFPPGPGLIPPTAQNLLFPRLPPRFHLPVQNFRPEGTDKAFNLESGSNGKSMESLLPQSGGERSYCNVPPFVPESMKLTPPESKAGSRKLESDSRKISKPLHSPDKILKSDDWAMPDNACKSVAIGPGGMPLIICEAPKSSDTCIKSPKPNIENPLFVGNMHSQNTSAKPAVAHVLSNDDPIELSDDSGEFPPASALSAYSSTEQNQNQIQLTAPPINFPHVEDLFLPSCNESGKETPADLDLLSKDSKKSKKANKFSKGTKIFHPNTTADLSPIDLFSGEKSGVGKLAGGADLIPLISTGSAYSSKTVPSTSLTATVAPPFVLSKNDFSPVNSFENALLSAKVDGNGILCTNTELQKKKKEHKKLKKLKEEKAKKKKDKKSKNKERIDRPEEILHKNEMLYKDTFKETLGCGEEQQLMAKDLLKKLKKEKKKKYKQLLTGIPEQTGIISGIDSCAFSNVDKSANIFSMGNPFPPLTSTTGVISSAPSLVPKLTLKLGSGQSPIPIDDTILKHLPNVTGIASNELGKKREPSPELARISPLVTRTPKLKFGIAETVTTSSLNCNQLTSITPGAGKANSTLESLADNCVKAVIPPNSLSVHSIVPPPSPWSSGGTISASSVLLPQQLLQSTKAQEQIGLSSKTDGGLLANTIASAAHPLPSSERPVPLISETSRPSSYIDAEGTRVWICPACGKVDDGSPMIGCDGCDAWYHWICVGISVAPKDNEDWFCRVCITRKKGIHATDKKRKRNKKK